MTTLHPSIDGTLGRSVNVALTSAVNQVTQYRQVGYAIRTWMLAMGWNLHAENNSAGGAIASAANIIFATPGSPRVHSWMTFERDGCYITYDFTNASGDTTPQQVTIVRGDVEPTGGTNNDRPTAGAGNESTANIDIIDWSSPVAGYISYVYSTEGIGWFMTKNTGGDGATNCAPIVIDAPDAADTMRDNSSSYGIWYGADGWYSNSYNATSMLTPNSDGSCVAGGSVGGYCDVMLLGNETQADGNTRLEPILWQGPDPGFTGVAARVLGHSRILRGTPYTTTWNASDAGDLDDWVWRTIGGATAILWYRTDGDIL